MITVYPRPITANEKYFGQVFQRILKILIDFFDKKNWEEWETVEQKLLQYSNVPYFKQVKKFIDDVNQQKAAIEKSQSIDMQQVKTISHQAEKALLSGNTDLFIELTQKIKHDYHLRDTKPNIYRYHPWHVENPLIFQRIGLLRSFEKDDQLKVLKIDFTHPLWTFLTIPPSKTDDFEFMVWWLLNLREDNSPVKLTTSEFQKYSQFAFAGDDFNKLKSLMDEYLHSNTKTLLKPIVDLINNHKELKQVNDNLKLKITRVFRGIPLDGGISTKTAIQNDRDSKLVATSENYNAAKRFALRIGHLQSEKDRRSEHGIVIEYNVTPDSILFSTDILGGIYNEKEVIIDASRATINKIYNV